MITFCRLFIILLLCFSRLSDCKLSRSASSTSVRALLGHEGVVDRVVAQIGICSTVGHSSGSVDQIIASR